MSYLVLNSEITCI